MASDDEGRLIIQDNFEWNVETEIRLFEAMIGHKPVGINKHFHMACINEKFESLLGRPISSDIIWKHLDSMYDLSALDKKESLPFPNDLEEFSLPESEYLELINEKLASRNDWNSESRENLGKEARNHSKLLKDSTPTKEGGLKKEKRSDYEDIVIGNESDKRDVTEEELETKKGKISKEEKIIKTRGKRNVKDKRGEENFSQVASLGNKKEEDNYLIQGGNKKEKQTVGKRSLRSRVEDISNKSLTPPPIKRARRI